METTAKMITIFFIKPNKNYNAGSDMLFSFKQRVTVEVPLGGIAHTYTLTQILLLTFSCLLL